MIAIPQRSMSGGELAPSLHARVDQSKYATGLRTLRNFFIMRHGGVANRPGTRLVCEVKDSTKRVRIIRWVFNTEQTYTLEWGHLYMRPLRNGAQILETAKVITGITQAAQAVVTSVAHGFNNGDEVVIDDVVGMTELNGRNFKVSDKTANDFKIKYMDGTYVNSTGFGAYTSGGTASRVYEIVTTYEEDELPDMTFYQSADVMTILHPLHAPAKLSRIDHDDWVLADYTFAPDQAAPTNLLSDAAGAGFKYVVTAINSETREESLASTEEDATTQTSTLTWTPASGATEYNVYKAINGVFGFIGLAEGTSFKDATIEPDTTVTPPKARNPFNAASEYPSCGTYYQQRLMFGNSLNHPTRIWGSRTGKFNNFTKSTPSSQDDDAIDFDLDSREVNSIKWMLDLGVLLVGTAGGEWSINGDASGTLLPTAINARQNGYNGSSSLQPLIIGGNALYVQGRGSVVRDLGFRFEEQQYRGNDLTIFSSHLFDGHSLVDCSYQQIPHSIAWYARDDGVLLGLTYIRDHQLWGWHRHDFGSGLVENVCSVSEGEEDALYVVVNRTIDGRAVRFIERMETRQVNDIVDSLFLDCALTYDGRNDDDSHTMTLSGGTAWDENENLTLTSSAAFFSADDVGNAIHLTSEDGTLVMCEIISYTSATVVTVRPDREVPVDLRSAATASWSRAVDQLVNLWHLEGETVGVFADGYVVGSPNNADVVPITVTNGSITLDRPYAVISVGLPYISDIYTLDIDTVQGETLINKKKLVTKVLLYVEATRGIFCGRVPPTDDADDPLEGLEELKIRADEGYDEPVALKSGVVGVKIKSNWDDNGRVFIRQVDPLPLTVLAIVPSGLVPVRG